MSVEAFLFLVDLKIDDCFMFYLLLVMFNASNCAALVVNAFKLD